MRKWARRLSAGLLCVLILVCCAFALNDAIVWPEASGTDVQQDDKLEIDCSHSADGYVMVKGPQRKKSMKLRVKANGGTLNYDINTDGEYEIIPLQLGDGKYTFSLFINSSGKKYAAGGEIKLTVQTSTAYSVYLVPNQYVQYDADSRAVALSDEICAGCTTDAEKLAAIKAYVIEHYTYDYIKSTTVTTGTMPSIDYVLDNGMGICQDLAALTACMLRVQGIPTRFIIGYAGKQYHAWNGVFIDGEEILYDPTADIGGVSGTAQYTIERYY